MKVTIIGPNLPRPLSDQGTLHVHKAGCAHLKRYPIKHYVDGPEGFDIIDVTTVKEVVTDIYDPSNFGYDPENPEEYAAYVGDIHFAPCTEELGDG